MKTRIQGTNRIPLPSHSVCAPLLIAFGLLMAVAPAPAADEEEQQSSTSNPPLRLAALMHAGRTARRRRFANGCSIAHDRSTPCGGALISRTFPAGASSDPSLRRRCERLCFLESAADRVWRTQVDAISTVDACRRSHGGLRSFVRH